MPERMPRKRRVETPTRTRLAASTSPTMRIMRAEERNMGRKRLFCRSRTASRVGNMRATLTRWRPSATHQAAR
jgi:hypothetical protein